LYSSSSSSRFLNRKRTEKSQDQHAIAVAVKAITLADRFSIGFEQEFPAGERAYQHEQSRARQMKIGKQKIDMSKLVGLVDKKIGRAGLRRQFSIFAPRGLQHPHGRRPDGNDPLRVVDPGRSFG